MPKTNKLWKYNVHYSHKKHRYTTSWHSSKHLQQQSQMWLFSAQTLTILSYCLSTVLKSHPQIIYLLIKPKIHTHVHNSLLLPNKSSPFPYINLNALCQICLGLQKQSPPFMFSDWSSVSIFHLSHVCPILSPFIWSHQSQPLTDGLRVCGAIPLPPICLHGVEGQAFTFLDLIIWILGERDKLWKSSTQLFLAFQYFLSLTSMYFLQHPLLNQF